MTRKGLYLQGGGAKGAYQAGVMCALKESGMIFEAIAGTSIGSINGYFWISDQMNELTRIWNTLKPPKDIVSEDNLFVKNRFLLDLVDDRRVDRRTSSHWFVNYAQVQSGQMLNRYEDLIGASYEKVIDVLNYSTRLPLRDAQGKYDLLLYEGMNIDGGMINNIFIDPLLELGLDEIVVIALNNIFEAPILETFKGKVTLIMPEIQFVKGDTIQTDHQKIMRWFKIGYDKTKARYPCD
jgi:predicted acylesterase/phospholipase RssA